MVYGMFNFEISLMFKVMLLLYLYALTFILAIVVCSSNYLHQLTDCVYTKTYDLSIHRHPMHTSSF